MEQIVLEIFTCFLGFCFGLVVCYAIYDHVKGGF